MASDVLGPVVLVLPVQILIGALLTGFSKPKSLLRKSSLPVMLCMSFYVLQTAPRQVREVWASNWTMMSLHIFMQYLDLSSLSCWSYETHGPGQRNRQTLAATKKDTIDIPNDFQTSTSQPTNADSMSRRLVFGWSSMCAYRHVGTTWEVAKVPPFSHKNPNFIPRRWTFVLQRVLIGSVCFLILDSLQLSPPPDENAQLFSLTKVPFFRRIGQVTPDELVPRLISVMTVYTTTFVLVQMWHSVLAAITVGLRISNVERWRPKFGSLSSAYSVRNFWGSFWHKNIRQMATSPATTIAQNILHLKPGSIPYRYARIVLTFAISGMMHHLAEYAQGIPRDETGVLQFFITQSFGIMIEDAVEALYRKAKGTTRTPTVPALHIRCLGFLWTLAFMMWSVPVWMFPYIVRPIPDGGSSLVPFSLIRALRK